ncbi:MAG: aquaporin [Actinobacteria bacterium]|nr:aquaporin [Actinomycetota bacterium]
MQHTTSQKLLAEFVGTFALIFIGVGSIVAVGAELGGLDGGGLTTIALAHGLAIGTMVSALGHVSGAHFNPAVTISAFVTGKIDLKDGGFYILAQLAGGAAAAGVLRAAIPATLRETVNSGIPGVGENFGLSTGQAVLIEAVLTFFLVWVIFATAVDSEGAFSKIAGLAIGFTITMDIMMGGPLTGAAMNPARAFGPALVEGFWDNHWVYWVGPVAGGIVAGVLYDLVILRPREERSAVESSA